MRLTQNDQTRSGDACGDGVISMGSATPPPQAGGAPELPVLGFPSICAHIL